MSKSCQRTRKDITGMKDIFGVVFIALAGLASLIGIVRIGDGDGFGIGSVPFSVGADTWPVPSDCGTADMGVDFITAEDGTVLGFTVAPATTNCDGTVLRFTVTGPDGTTMAGATVHDVTFGQHHEVLLDTPVPWDAMSMIRVSGVQE